MTGIQGLSLFKKGKVRDIFEISNNRLLMVATDRISAFDVIMEEIIPHKGKVLTQISNMWMRLVGEAGITKTHLIETDFNQFPIVCSPYRESIEERSVVVEKAAPFPVECIVRGYLAGSGWKSYQKNGTVCGIPLPSGLKESEKLPEPIFTPSTKAGPGEHDQNISFKDMTRKVGQGAAFMLRDMSIRIYEMASKIAEEKGIIIADTKFEFGISDESGIVLIDELLTPDSSRFWPVSGYEPGGPQPSFDKQILRDFLSDSGWSKDPPAPSIPKKVIDEISRRYLKIAEMLDVQIN
jgi:phosphoribosylaminoimidazole-succinocarboxamide synthase